MMKTTRQTIIDYIKIHTCATANEIGQALHITAANVRHHLAVLSEEGVIAIVGQKPAKKRGRPGFLYSLSALTHQNNMDSLEYVLWDLYLNMVTDKEKEHRMRNIARLLAYPLDQPSENYLTKRLSTCIRKLCDLNYVARWEAHVNSPQIIIEHCPYASVISKQPELCLVDKFLLEELLRTPVIQLSKLEKSSPGILQCKFITS